MPDIQDPADRGAALAANRNVKMARSAHAYVRGNTAKFYDWLSGVTATCPECNATVEVDLSSLGG